MRWPRQRTAVRRPTAWGVLVPVVCLIAGVGFAASARDSRGTDLRAPGITSLVDTVGAAEARVRAADGQVRSLRTQVQAAVALAGRGDSAVARAQRRVTPLMPAAGLTALRGPGVVVVLDDAAGVDGSSAADDNERVVHSSDLRAVVDALWAGGAEAMTVAGQRVVPTTSIRCVGPTLLLNGEVFSPPYRVAAIGPSAAMQQMLRQSPGVSLFREAAGYYGLGYTEGTMQVRMPGYSGSLSLSYAVPGR